LSHIESDLELSIDSVRVGIRQQRPVVVLKEVSGERYLAIWVGSDMAQAITFALQDQETPRPMTHDLLLNTIEMLGGKVKEVRITSLKEDVYFARIIIEQDGDTHSIDSRTSDALAIAVRSGANIMASQELMEEASIQLPDDDDDDFNQELLNPVTDEELRKLSPFRDLVEGLDLDNLGETDSEE
jgi:bifunctional DNase/RNase